MVVASRYFSCSGTVAGRAIKLVTGLLPRSRRPKGKLTLHLRPATEFKPEIIGVTVTSLRRSPLVITKIAAMPLASHSDDSAGPIRNLAKPLRRGDSLTLLYHPEALFGEGCSLDQIAYVYAVDQFGGRHRLLVASRWLVACSRLRNAVIAGGARLEAARRHARAKWLRV